MAREEELKRIDLKVNVSCCEGCRRKVMKAMSLKGVLRTEIQPSHDRVTVVGDVDAKVLVKKLAKIGKIAEVLPPAPAASEEGKKRDDGGNRKDGDRAAHAEERSGCTDDGKSAGDKQAKAAGKQECKKCAHDAARADGDHASGKAPLKVVAAAKTNEEDGDGDGLGAKSLEPDRHAAPQPQMQQHYHRAEPPMVVPGFYAPAPAPYYSYYGMPPPPPPMMTSMLMPPMGLPPQLRPQPSRFDEDFFNDDNTIGCRVM